MSTSTQKINTTNPTNTGTIEMSATLIFRNVFFSLDTEMYPDSPALELIGNFNIQKCKIVISISL